MDNSNPLSLVSKDIEPRASLTSLLGSEVTQALLLLAERVSSEIGSPNSGEGNLDLVALARKIYQARRDRDEIFATDLFSNPSWDMLLAAYWLPETGEDLTVGRLLLASGSPKTTAWRCLTRLIETGLLESRRSATDRRSAKVALSPTGRNKVEAYLQKISEHHFSLVEVQEHD